MPNHTHPHNVHKRLWRQANVRLFPSAVLSIVGAVVASGNGHVRSGNFNHRIIALLGVILFLIFATAFLRVLTRTITQIASIRHLSIGRAAALQFILRIVGYVGIFLITLDLVGVPVGKLLLGGAAIGIILGVAAQQALANFFASVVLIVAHPFEVGEHVTITAGALGGAYEGDILDIGLTHTRLQEVNGRRILLPNATLLSSAAISKNLVSTENITTKAD